MVLKLAESSEPTTYYKFGPEAGAPENHWYEFLYDGDTGALIEGNVITLHFVDGGRGDDDLDANGEIVEPGGPGWINASDDGNSSGGCFLETVTNLQDAKVKR